MCADKGGGRGFHSMECDVGKRVNISPSGHKLEGREGRTAEARAGWWAWPGEPRADQRLHLVTHRPLEAGRKVSPKEPARTVLTLPAGCFLWGTKFRDGRHSQGKGGQGWGASSSVAARDSRPELPATTAQSPGKYILGLLRQGGSRGEGAQRGMERLAGSPGKAHSVPSAGGRFPWAPSTGCLEAENREWRAAEARFIGPAEMPPPPGALSRRPEAQPDSRGGRVGGTTARRGDRQGLDSAPPEGGRAAAAAWGCWGRGRGRSRHPAQATATAAGRPG